MANIAYVINKNHIDIHFIFQLNLLERYAMRIRFTLVQVLKLRWYLTLKQRIKLSETETNHLHTTIVKILKICRFQIFPFQVSQQQLVKYLYFLAHQHTSLVVGHQRRSQHSHISNKRWKRVSLENDNFTSNKLTRSDAIILNACCNSLYKCDMWIDVLSNLLWCIINLLW